MISLRGRLESTLGRRRSGAVLPAAVARQRQHACAATAAGASAIATRADVGRSGGGSRTGWRSTWRCSTMPAWWRPASTRSDSIGLSATTASACGSTARRARRCGSSWRSGREGTAARVCRERGVLIMATSTRSIGARDCAAACWPRRPLTLGRDRRASWPTIRWRASPTPRTPPASASGRSIWRSISRPTCSPARATRHQRARAQRQHHRRGARFELVHQPHPRAAGDDRRAVARSADRRRPGAGPVDGDLRRSSAGFAPGFTMRDRAASAGSCRSTPRGIPKRRPARLPSPTRSSGRSATGRSRTISSPSRPTARHRPTRRCSRRRPGRKRRMRDARP